MITRILIPTDYSELAAHAARYARFLAAAHGAQVHVLHVVSPSSAVGVAPTAGDIGAVALLPDSATLIQAQAPRMSAFAGSCLQAAGLMVITEVRVGLPCAVICAYAREQGIDLIVIGTHARSLVNRIFFGSTSKAVLESAPCPVLMVPLATLSGPKATPATAAGSGD